MPQGCFPVLLITLRSFLILRGGTHSILPKRRNPEYSGFRTFFFPLPRDYPTCSGKYKTPGALNYTNMFSKDTACNVKLNVLVKPKSGTCMHLSFSVQNIDLSAKLCLFVCCITYQFLAPIDLFGPRHDIENENVI